MKKSPKDSSDKKLKQFESATPKENFVESFAWSSNQLTHLQPKACWISLRKNDIRRPRHGIAIGTPQLLLYHSPVSRESWRLKSVLDLKGPRSNKSISGDSPACVCIVTQYSLGAGKFSCCQCLFVCSLG